EDRKWPVWNGALRDSRTTRQAKRSGDSRGGVQLARQCQARGAFEATETMNSLFSLSLSRADGTTLRCPVVSRPRADGTTGDRGDRGQGVFKDPPCVSG